MNEGLKNLLIVETLRDKAIDGVVILNCENSNPNGDPDVGGAPRKDSEDFGLISAESIKRKLRDLVEDETVMATARKVLGIPQKGFEILESHRSKGKNGENRADILKMSDADFRARFWDVRVFGAMLLDDSKKDKKDKKDKTEKSHKNFRGAFQFVHASSVSRVIQITQSVSRKTGTNGDKDRGLGPNAINIIKHAVYPVYFSYRPALGKATGTTDNDLKLLFFLIDKIFDSYSVNRVGVDVVKTIVGVHKNALGTFNRYIFKDSVKPIRKGEDKSVPSSGLGDYVLCDTEGLKNLDGDFFSIV
ncbi:MAG: type I CRISPR-associated protein Cas7 [Candidatus Omnitrophica bacterium]|nr:type I CRISPR-associated protein Cas7 [Candidatus Omnitrophota bacterium]